MLDQRLISSFYVGLNRISLATITAIDLVKKKKKKKALWHPLRYIKSICVICLNLVSLVSNSELFYFKYYIWYFGCHFNCIHFNFCWVRLCLVLFVPFLYRFDFFLFCCSESFFYPQPVQMFICKHILFSTVFMDFSNKKKMYLSIGFDVT